MSGQGCRASIRFQSTLVTLRLVIVVVVILILSSSVAPFAETCIFEVVPVIETLILEAPGLQ